MGKTFYVDTCVWRDFYENRISRSGRFLGNDANSFFIKVIKRKDVILFSDSLLWELRKAFDDKSINELLEIFFITNILQKVAITKEENDEAKVLSLQRNIPFIDCLHAIQARNHNAILVSQDKHLLIDLKDIVLCKRPSAML